MLRNLLVFFAAFVVLTLLFVWSENQIARSFQSCVSEQRAQNATERTNNQGEYITAARAQATCSFRLIDRHNGFFAALAAVAVAAFTFTLWIATDRQARLTGESIKLAREEFIATHRPKIIIRAVEVTRREVRDRILIGASLLAFNNGETAAKNVEVRGEIFMGPRFAIDVQRPIIKNFSQVSSGQKLRVEITSDWEVSKAAASKRTGIVAYCVGWIAYWDESGQRRETGFCFQPEFGVDGDRWVSAGKPEYEYEY